MKIGINLSVIGEIENLAQLPGIFQNLGTKNIELPVRLWQKTGAENALIKDLNVINFSNLLHKTSIFPLSIFVSEDAFSVQYESLDEKLEISKNLGCTNVSLGIDPWTEVSEDEARKLFIERIRKCAFKAAKKGINLNLEYISHKVSKNNGDEKEFLFCPSLKDAVRLIRDVNLKNVKLLLDFLHWYCDGGVTSVADVSDILGFVHICDHLETNREKIGDSCRVLPFEGRLPVKDFLKKINESNYLGFISVEVFKNSSYSPDSLAIRKSIDKIKGLLF